MRDKKMKKFTSMREQTTKKAPARAAGLCQLSLFDQTSTTPLSYTAAGTPVRRWLRLPPSRLGHPRASSDGARLGVGSAPHPSCAAHTGCSGTARIS